jgi:hypothetical protein
MEALDAPTDIGPALEKWPVSTMATTWIRHHWWQLAYLAVVAFAAIAASVQGQPSGGCGGG